MITCSSTLLANEHEIILTEKSDDPTAIKLELGWNDKLVIGDLNNLFLVLIVQHFSYLL